MIADRQTLLLCGAVALPFLLFMGYSAAMDPLAEQRFWLAEQLAQIEISRPAASESEESLSEWQTSMQSRPTAWQPITEAPVVVELPPEKKECPDVKAMLQGVVPGRAQIGAKIRIATPENQRGDWYVVGDSIKGCKIESIERTEVVFSYFCKEQNRTITIMIPRG